MRGLRKPNLASDGQPTAREPDRAAVNAGARARCGKPHLGSHRRRSGAGERAGASAKADAVAPLDLPSDGRDLAVGPAKIWMRPKIVSGSGSRQRYLWSGA